MNEGRIELRLIDKEKDKWQLTLDDGTVAKADGLKGVPESVAKHYGDQIGDLQKQLKALREDKATINLLVKMARSRDFRQRRSNYVALEPVPGRPYRTYNMGNDENVELEKEWSEGKIPEDLGKPTIKT